MVFLPELGQRQQVQGLNHHPLSLQQLRHWGRPAAAQGKVDNLQH
jgi:hypothetical protein